MIIGITGLMGSGKTTLCRELSRLTGIHHLDVDVFRRELEVKFNRLSYLGSIMYCSNQAMQEYKQNLYKELESLLASSQNDLLLDWALLIQDRKTNLCDRLIVLQTPLELIYERNVFNNLSESEVKLRLDIQSVNFLLDDIDCDYISMPLPDLKQALDYITREVC